MMETMVVMAIVAFALFFTLRAFCRTARGGACGRCAKARACGAAGRPGMSDGGAAAQ